MIRATITKNQSNNDDDDDNLYSIASIARKLSMSWIGVSHCVLDNCWMTDLVGICSCNGLSMKTRTSHNTIANVTSDRSEEIYLIKGLKLLILLESMNKIVCNS